MKRVMGKLFASESSNYSISAYLFLLVQLGNLFTQEDTLRALPL